MRFIKYNWHICLGQAYHVVVCVAKTLIFKAMNSTTGAELDLVQAEGEPKVDSNITVQLIQAAVEEYLLAQGCRHFHDIIDEITRAKTTWSSRPKVSLFRSKRL